MDYNISPDNNERFLQRIDRLLFGKNELQSRREICPKNCDELLKNQARTLELQKKYLALFHSAPIGYFVFDTDFLITQVNQTAAKLLRMEKFRLIGLPFVAFVETDYYETFLLFRQRILDKKNRQTCELKIRTKDNQVFYSIIESVPVFDKEHNIIQILSILSDITEYKHAEAIERKRHLQTTIDNILDPFTVLKPLRNESGEITDFVCEYINEVGLKSTKLSRRENRGKGILTFFPYFGESGLFDNACKVLETGRPISRDDLHSRRLNDDGTYEKFFTVRITKLDESVVINWKDITEKNKIEEALRVSEEKYKSMVQNIPIGIYSTTSDGRILYANPSLIEMLGYSTFEELARRNLEEEGYENQNYSRSEFKRLLEQKDEIKGFESAWIKRNGETIYVRENARIVKKENNICFYEGTVEDITDVRNYQKKLETTLNELERSNKDLEHLAYVASHDLQEPLRVVTSYVKLFSNKYKGKLDAKAEEYAGFITEGINRMQMLVNDLLKYARITTNKPEYQKVNCNKIVEELLVDLKFMLQEKDVTIISHALPEVYAVPTQIRQLFQNLISNAIKFRSVERKPEITISAENKGKEWLFKVSDNGIGIEPKHFERIFLLFQRLHEREKYPGTGIGLALCKRIVDQHGGRIWVESTLGEGSTFYFTLPGK